MIATEPRIDITRLEKVKRTGAKLTARCPACAANGSDRTGVHFFFNVSTGQWGCGALPGDGEHRKEIFALVGIRGERRPDPERDRRWRMDRDEETRRQSAAKALTDAATQTRAGIIKRHPWALADVWEDSPQRIDCPLVELDPRHFIASLFPQDVTVWVGEVHHSGTRHADHWRTVKDWQDAPNVGPMVAPCVWKPGTLNRTAENVERSPFVVLDFDGVNGKPPSTAEEISQHVQDSLAIVRWLHSELYWNLAAIVWTGSKSLHAWFHSPPAAAVHSLRTTASALGVDPGLVGRPEHPCRLPGQLHAKTGGMSRVLWLQNRIL